MRRRLNSVFMWVLLIALIYPAASRVHGLGSHLLALASIDAISIPKALKVSTAPVIRHSFWAKSLFSLRIPPTTGASLGVQGAKNGVLAENWGLLHG